MTDERHRATNRRAIATAFGVWTVYLTLDRWGADSFVALSGNRLATAGLIALSIVLTWTWFRPRLGRADGVGEESGGDYRHEHLVSLEIAALSGMLIFLMAQVPL